MTSTVRGRIDGELSKRIGQWFTVREIQDKLHVNPATLKPLIMRYARESVLRRRKMNGTARSVQFSPAARKIGDFRELLIDAIPYRNFRHRSNPMLLQSKGLTNKKASTKKSRSVGKKGRKGTSRSRR